MQRALRQNRLLILWLALACYLMSATVAWAEPLTLTEKDNGRAFTVKVDQKIIFDLRYPGGVGYELDTPDWDVRVLRILGTKIQTNTTVGPKGRGDFARTAYHFEAWKEGATDVVVRLKSPGEQEPKEYLRVKIKVMR